MMSMNFQIFESFLNVIQQHPCYLAEILKQINNKKTFDYLIKLIYGRNTVHLNSKRINSLFLGLWNNLFSYTPFRFYSITASIAFSISASKSS